MFIFTETSSNSTENSKVDRPAKVSCAPSSQSHPAKTESHKVSRNEQRQHWKVLTETGSTTRTPKMKTAGKASWFNLNSEKMNAAKGPEVTEPLQSPHPKSSCEIGVHFNTVDSVNVTLRKPSREEYLMGTEAGKASEHFTPRVTVEPFLLKEAPVRDDSQSDWSLSSNGSTFTSNIHLTHSYPSKHPDPLNFESFPDPTVDLDFGSTIGDNSDVTVYKEIAKKPPRVKPMKNADVKLTKNRQPIPGSEDEAIRKACPKSLLSQFKLCQQDSGFDSPGS